MGRTIGLIGLGLMGGAVARHLLEKGHRVIAWNRTPGKVEAIEGLERANTPSEVLARAGTAVLLISDDRALEELLDAEDGLLEAPEGSLVINSSTNTPAASLRAQRRLAEAGIGYVEAPVLGGPPVARKGELIGIIAGEEEAKKKALATIGEYTRKTVDAGVVPGAMVVKLAMNSLFFNTLIALGEAAQLVARWNAPLEALVEAGSSTWTRFLFEKYYNRMMADEHPVGFRLSMAAKDLAYFIEASREKNAPAHLTSGSLQAFLEAAREGLGGEDYSRAAWRLAKGPRR